MINLASDLDGTIYEGNELIKGVEETYKLLIKKKVNKNIIFSYINFLKKKSANIYIIKYIIYA